MASGERASGASVLLTEDDFNFRDTLEDVLLEDGHAVVCARNGSEALATLPRLPRPALVLLDLHMPVMDGVTFLTHLQERPDRQDFEVVIMSAVVDPQWFARWPGVVRAMRKPFDVQEIQTLADDFARRRPRVGPRRRDGAG